MTTDVSTAVAPREVTRRKVVIHTNGWPIAFLAAVLMICFTTYCLLVGAGVVDPNLIKAGVR